MNFFNEETGELGRTICNYEIGRDHPGDLLKDNETKKNNIKEEMADVLDQLLIFCSKYDITVDELLKQSEDKLNKRFF